MLTSILQLSLNLINLFHKAIALNQLLEVILVKASKFEGFTMLKWNFFIYDLFC